MSINSPNLQITSSNTIKTRIPSLASIYQAKKSGDHSVEVLKQKFQTGIEHKIQHGHQQQHAWHQNSPKPFFRNSCNHEENFERNQNVRQIGNLNLSHKNLVKVNSEAMYAEGKSNNVQPKRHSIASPTQRPRLPPPLPPTLTKHRGDNGLDVSPQPYTATSNSISKGSDTLRKLEREKSFEDARNAVQSQIEKIFQKQNNAKQSDQTNAEGSQSPCPSAAGQAMRRHDVVIGMGTPTLPGIFPSMSSQNKRSIDHTDFIDHENNNYRSSMNIRNDPLPPPPPPLPPNIPLHSLGILQKRMIVESSMNKEKTRPNMSSLSTKHRSMDSLVTAKIATPETIDYSSPPLSPTRRNSPQRKGLRNFRQNIENYEAHPTSNIYGVIDRHNSSLQPSQGSRKSALKESHAQDIYSSNIENERKLGRQDIHRYKSNNSKRDGKEMRRSISHNSLAMRNGNQNQLHNHLSQQNSYKLPFKLHPSNSGELQSTQRKYHPQYHPRYPEKHFGDGNKHGSHIMTSSYPSDGGTTATMGPMSMFGDFSIDPLKKDPRMQLSHPEIHRGKLGGLFQVNE